MKMRRGLRVFKGAGSFLVLCTLALFCACRKPSANGRETWAEVDGQPIFREEVERIFRSRIAAGMETASPEQALSFKLSVLTELIDNQVLQAHAAHTGITVSEAEVDSKLGELESPYSKEEFQNKLKQQGLEMDDLRRQIRTELIITKLMNKEISSRVVVSDAEITEYYQRNKGSFNVPEARFHLAQIEVTPVADAEVRNLKNDDAKSGPAAERKIQALYARLEAGDDFATVAAEYSEDPRTAAGGGDMGFVPASALDSSLQLKQVVTSLKVGQMSGIFRTSAGYHIIKLLSKEEPGQRLISDLQVQAAIRQTLKNEKEQLLKAAYVEDLRNRAKVVNYLAEQIVKAEGAPAAGK
jgi:peptidyl-prolyl cis-trans isomerase SurA